MTGHPGTPGPLVSLLFFFSRLCSSPSHPFIYSETYSPLINHLCCLSRLRANRSMAIHRAHKVAAIKADTQQTQTRQSRRPSFSRTFSIRWCPLTVGEAARLRDTAEDLSNTPLLSSLLCSCPPVCVIDRGSPALAESQESQESR